MKCMITTCHNTANKILYSKVKHGKSLYGCLCDEHGEERLNEFLDMGREAGLQSL